jgi:two-component sensor histidine kinase
MFDRLEEERQRDSTAGWSLGELRKAFLAVEEELVTNSIRHGPSAPATIGLFIEVANDRMRVEVSDGADAAPRLRPPTENGGHGLTLVDTLATRWHTSRDGDRNLTWFELDLPAPGA